MAPRRVVCILFAMLVSGCVAPVTTENSKIHDLVETVTLGVEIDDPQSELLYLGDEIKRELSARIDPDWSNRRKSIELSEFLFGESEQRIRYDPMRSEPAAGTYEAKRGNCLSVSSLYVAAARHLGIDSRFETVELSPSWAQEAVTTIRYEHIVASGLVNGKIYVVDVLSSARSNALPRTRITDEQALALYYSNLAVEALIPGGLDTSFDYLRRAIRLWPENSNIWNNVGAVYRRTGDAEMAEASFVYALILDRYNYSALANLTRHYLMEGQADQADQYMKEVRRYYRRNPYYHIQLAAMQIDGGNVDAARENLERAAKLQRDDPALHTALADSYARLGDMNRSLDHRQTADVIRTQHRIRQTEDDG